MWTVLAWVPHAKDPYRLGQGLVSARFRDYNQALCVANVLADRLQRVPRIVIEVFRSEESDLSPSSDL